MANRGHLLIQQLILMYAELKRAGVIARTLAPTTIFVDQLCESMIMTDITALAYHQEPVYYFPPVVMPYNNSKLGVNPFTMLTSPDWDLWSIGMMSLEIIVGSELVLQLTTQEDVESLVQDIRPFIPTSTHLLLTEMLLYVRDANAVVNAKSEYFETIYKIEEAVNGMEAAKTGNSIIKKRVDQFNAYAAENPEELATSYQWKPNLEKQ